MYYYFSASLPSLSFGQNPGMSVADFDELASGQMSPETLAKLKIGTLAVSREPGSAAELAPALRSANILINNASVFVRRTLLEESGTEADRQFRINYTAPVELMKLFAETGSGPRLIINMLDQGIQHPDATSFSYAVSKKALAAATEAAALQLAPGIRVNGIAPGPVLPPVELPLSKMEKTLKTVPLGRPVALEDLCSACLFLAQNEP